MKASSYILNIIVVSVYSNLGFAVNNESDIDTLPRLGALVAKEGHVTFIRAVLMVQFKANVEDYVEG